LASAFLAAASASTAAIAQQTAPQVRIVTAVDENQLVTLKGNVPPAASAANDRGPVSASLPMKDLVMVLSRGAEQQAAFDAFVNSQYDSGSPNFHQWLAPDEIGMRFGPSMTDIATVSNWLAGHGFTVGEVSKDRMTIRFSGTAGQVESAFHTQIHNLSVKGEAHISNVSDPQIPAALAPVVMGIKQLHDFHPHPLHRTGGIAIYDSATRQWLRSARPSLAGSVQSSASADTVASLRASGIRPQFGINVPNSGSPYRVEDVTPYDFATIYNVLPLWNAGTPIDGTGQTIAITGTTDIQPADVATFRSTFGLPAGLTPIQMKGVNGYDPGVCTTTSTTALCNLNDLYENSLDVEWSGAVAKGAQIVLVTSGYNNATSPTNDPIYDSASYIISHQTAKILSASYGICELGNGTAGNVTYHDLWQSAAAEGIAVFIASGDSGAPACDQGGDAGGTPYVADYGLSVNGLGSTAFNVSVGGTDFNWCSLTATSECPAAPYWNSTNSSTLANAAGYVPEVPWDDTCSSPLTVGFLKSYFGNNFGVTVNDAETGCNALVDYAPTISESSAAVLLDLVDTVGGGGGASNCVVGDQNNVSSCSGTITSTGSSYESLPLVHDGWPKPSWQSGVTGIPSDGVRDIPDVSFFASDGFLSSSAYLICVSDPAASLSCTYSATAEPSGEEVGGTSVGTPAMAGVMALINQKWGNQGLPNSVLYSLAGKQNYSSCSAETGTVSNGCYFNDIDSGTNSMPCDYGVGGDGISPNCTAIHSGDGVGLLTGNASGTGFDLATGLGSLNVANVVNATSVWMQLGSAAATVTVSPASGSITANQSLSVSITVAGASGTPTGTVILTGGGYTSASTALSSGKATIVIPASSLTGTGGSFSVTLTATYSGDTTYASESGTASVTVTKLASTVTVTPAASATNSNVPFNVAVAVTGSGGTPTGTVTLTAGAYSSSASTLTNGAFTFTIPANSFAAGGAVALNVAYSGDNTYTSGSGTNSVMVTLITVATPTVTVTPASTTIDSSQSLNVTVAVAGTNGTATGTISLSGGGYNSTVQTIGVSACASAASCVFAIPANSFTTYGTSFALTAHYSGDVDYLTNTGTANITVTQSMYSLTATTPAAISPGASTTSTITGQTSSTDYTGTVTLGTCTLTNEPTGASSLPTCSASGTVTYASGTASGSGTASVSTTASTAMLETRPGFKGFFGAGGGAVLAFLVFLGIPARRRSWRALLGVLVILAAIGSLSACGGGGGGGGGTGTPGTTAGSYTFTVAGQGNDPASTKETVTFNLTVN
jgi:hypothetical protein